MRNEWNYDRVYELATRIGAAIWKLLKTDEGKLFAGLPLVFLMLAWGWDTRSLLAGLLVAYMVFVLRRYLGLEGLGECCEGGKDVKESM